jgi:hypothetical protein
VSGLESRLDRVARDVLDADQRRRLRATERRRKAQGRSLRKPEFWSTQTGLLHIVGAVSTLCGLRKGKSWTLTKEIGSNSILCSICRSRTSYEPAGLTEK